jgi:hypothetical protein
MLEPSSCGRQESRRARRRRPVHPVDPGLRAPLGDRRVLARPGFGDVVGGMGVAPLGGAGAARACRSQMRRRSSCGPRLSSSSRGHGGDRCGARCHRVCVEPQRRASIRDVRYCGLTLLWFRIESGPCTLADRLGSDCLRVLASIDVVLRGPASGRATPHGPCVGLADGGRRSPLPRLVRHRLDLALASNVECGRLVDSCRSCSGPCAASGVVFRRTAPIAWRSPNCQRSRVWVED